MPVLVRTPAPHPTESLFGFLLRTAESNGYSDFRTVLRLAGVSRGITQSVIPGVPLLPLAAVLNRKPSELRPIMYRHGETRKVPWLILGHQLGGSASNALVRFKALTICPQCVEENRYVSAFWDLAPSVACALHGRTALDQCPSCHEPLSWIRDGLLTCSCGASWEGWRGDHADAATLDLMMVIHAKLFRESLARFENASKLPIDWLESLSLQALLHMVDLLGVQGATIETGVRSQTAIVHAAARSLADWPNGYHELLRSIGTRHIASVPGVRGLCRQFQQFYRKAFQPGRGAAKLEFLRREFVRFGLDEWGHGIVDAKLRRRYVGETPRFIGRVEFEQTHHLTSPTVDRLIREGSIVASTAGTEDGRIVIDLQKTKVPPVGRGGEVKPENVLAVREAAKRIGLPVSVIRELQRRNLIARDPRRGHGGTWYEPDVNRFITKGKRLARGRARVGAVTVRDLMKLRLSDCAAKADIVAAVFDGRLRVVGRVGPDLGGLQVEREQATSFVFNLRIGRESGTCTPTEAAVLSGISPEAVSGAVALGLLDKVVPDGPIRVTCASIERFEARYALLAELAKDLATSAYRLQRICQSEQIATVAIVRAGHTSPQSVVEREYIPQLILAHESTKHRSRLEIKAIHLERLRAYLDELKQTGQRMPRREGKPSMAGIAHACGFGRSVLCKSPELLGLLGQFDSDERAAGLDCARPAERLQRYLRALRNEGRVLPMWKGKPNILKISKECGFNRYFFTTDRDLVKLVRRAARVAA